MQAHLAYLVYGWSEADPNLSLAEPLRAVPPLFNATLGALQRQRLDETSVSIGARWDIGNNVALKFDYTRYNTKVAGQNDGDALVVGAVFSF